MLSIVEQLSYATIRIDVTISNGHYCGTGFIMSFGGDEHSYKPMLVTNGHVMDGADMVSLCFTTADDQGNPVGKWQVSKPVNECYYRFHPQFKASSDGDLCALALAPFFKDAEVIGQRLKFKMLQLDMLANDVDYAELMQLDEVAMVGYPNAIADEVNNQPIFRRGVLATNPSLDYDGRKEFLTDIATIGGSSGSPVLQVNNGVSINQRTGSVCLGGSKCRLLGIHRGGFRYDAEGRLVKITMPEADGIISSTRIPINLGVVIKASRIFELARLFD